MKKTKKKRNNKKKKRQIKRHKSLRANTDDPDLPNPVSDRTADVPARERRLGGDVKTKRQKVKSGQLRDFNGQAMERYVAVQEWVIERYRERDSSQPGKSGGNGSTVRLLYSPPDWSDDLHATNRFRFFDRQ